MLTDVQTPFLGTPFVPLEETGRVACQRGACIALLPLSVPPNGEEAPVNAFLVNAHPNQSAGYRSNPCSLTRNIDSRNRHYPERASHLTRARMGRRRPWIAVGRAQQHHRAFLRLFLRNVCAKFSQHDFEVCILEPLLTTTS